MGESGINALGIEHMSFMNPDNNMVLQDHGFTHNHDHSMTM